MPRRKTDRKRLAWIHSFPCIVPNCEHLDIEADHVGARGYGVRCGDDETLPVCSQHHRTGKDARHVLGRKFWDHHGIDRAALLSHYAQLYESFLARTQQHGNHNQAARQAAYQTDPF